MATATLPLLRVFAQHHLHSPRVGAASTQAPTLPIARLSQPPVRSAASRSQLPPVRSGYVAYALSISLYVPLAAVCTTIHRPRRQSSATVPCALCGDILVFGCGLCICTTSAHSPTTAALVRWHIAPQLDPSSSRLSPAGRFANEPCCR